MLDVRLEHPRPACPICGGKAKRIAIAVHKGVNLPYSLCRDCTAIFQSPTIAESALDHFYSAIYPEIYARHGNADLMETQERRAADFTRYVAGKAEAPSTVLEIGCSAGFLGRAILSAFPGVQYFGVELDDALSVAAARSFPVARSVEGHGDQKYDLILMSHVLEHFFDPVRELQMLAGRLAPGGRIIVEVPNGNAGSGFEIAHPFIFTTPSLERLAVRAGLVVLDATEHNSFKARSGYPLYLSASFGAGAAETVRPSTVDRARIKWRVASSGGRKATLLNAIRYACGRSLGVRV